MDKYTKRISLLNISICVFAIFLSAIFLILGYKVHFHTGLICDWVDNNIIEQDGVIPFLQDHPDLIFYVHQAKTNTQNLLLAGIGIFVTFIAFYIQYVFNTRQKKDLSLERFENQYFHFLDVYRDIVNTTALKNVGKGKIVFHYMFYEYKALYRIIKAYIESNISREWSADRINNIVFTFFINGISRDIDLIICDSEISVNIQREIKESLFHYQENSEFHESKDYFDNGVCYLKDYRQQHIKYFDGHRFRLIPYYKYIFMIIDHILSARDKSEIEKERTIKYLFCEMSEHEIGLIYAYAKYINIDLRYIPYLDLLYKELPADMAYKFKFDSEHFISI